jgi:hypothetical protein
MASPDPAHRRKPRAPRIPRPQGQFTMRDVGYESFVPDCRTVPFGCWKAARIVSRTQGRLWWQFSLGDPNYPLTSPVPIDFEHPYRPPDGSRLHTVDHYRARSRNESETAANLMLFYDIDLPPRRPDTAPPMRPKTLTSRRDGEQSRPFTAKRSPKPPAFHDCLNSLDELQGGKREEGEAIMVRMSLTKRKDGTVPSPHK